MTTQTEAPKEEAQVTNPMDAQWESDFPEEDLRIPYSREEPETEEKEDAGDDTKEDQIEEVPQAPEVESVVTLPDPGTYEPKDYSFEFDIEGKKYTISSSSDIDNIDEEDLAKLSAKKLTELIRKGNAADSNAERDKALYDEKKAAYDAQAEEQGQRDEIISGWATELDYLVSKGYIPEIEEKYRAADWSDPEVAKQPGVKEQKAILDYMEKENDARLKVGVKPLTSIVDAYNAMEMESSRSNKQEKDEKVAKARKAAGARVAGTSNNPPGTPTPKGIAVGRTNALTNNASVWE